MSEYKATFKGHTKSNGQRIAIYEYRGYRYDIHKTNIPHIDKESHRINQSHIDKVIHAKENPTKPTKSNQECLDDFMKMIEN